MGKPAAGSALACLFWDFRGGKGLFCLLMGSLLWAFISSSSFTCLFC